MQCGTSDRDKSWYYPLRVCHDKTLNQQCLGISLLRLSPTMVYILVFMMMKHRVFYRGGGNWRVFDCSLLEPCPSISLLQNISHSVVMMVFFYRFKSTLSEFLHNPANRDNKCRLCMLHETAQLTREIISRHLICVYLIRLSDMLRCQVYLSCW